ncbi:hypothetical protein FB45DRAFT_1018683 [Roridomyces roridus]|uniref:Uncharacterized protein n=1 Tax=Roridomyces roridus TaxID=1738132 RepID=A0AAD7CKY1_9AGAR|nr:hypothetical protein FB45DRAFT_1018683 [Roridomyces roridus]
MPPPQLFSLDVTLPQRKIDWVLQTLAAHLADMPYDIVIRLTLGAERNLAAAHQFRQVMGLTSRRLHMLVLRIHPDMLEDLCRGPPPPFDHLSSFHCTLSVFGGQVPKMWSQILSNAPALTDFRFGYPPEVWAPLRAPLIQLIDSSLPIGRLTVVHIPNIWLDGWDCAELLEQGRQVSWNVQSVLTEWPPPYLNSESKE